MTEKPTITMIYPAYLMQSWPFVSALLAPAVERDATHDIEDVRKQIIGGQAQLWVQWSGDIDAAVVTEFVNYPKGVWFRFWLAGARNDVKVEWKMFFDTLVKFANDNNCKGIEDCGRTGWSKYCPEKVRNIGVMRRMELGGSNV